MVDRLENYEGFLKAVAKVESVYTIIGRENGPNRMNIMEPGISDKERTARALKLGNCAHNITHKTLPKLRLLLKVATMNCNLRRIEARLVRDLLIQPKMPHQEDRLSLQ